MDSKQASQVTTGMIVLAIGLMLLASQLDVGWAWDFGRLWPVVFLVLGAGRFLSSDGEGRGSGAWFLFLGAIFLLHTFRVLPLGQSWPLFVVAAGVSMIFGRARRGGRS